MSFHLFSSHSNNLCYKHHLPLCNSLSPSHIIIQFSPSLISWTPNICNHSLKLDSLSTQPRSSMPSFVCLQNPVLEESPNPPENPPNSLQFQYPKREITSSTSKKYFWVNPKKNYVWVNPASPSASELREESYVARYNFLLKIAESLNSCNPTEIDVSRVLSSLCEKKHPVEQDAVVVLSKMTNPKTVLLALKFFRQELKWKREVVLYNVTLKVLRKKRDLDGAEKLFEEMLERGVIPDRITLSILIGYARWCARPDKALEWYEKILQFGCKPDESINSAMIDVYGRTGNVDMALSLYHQARREEWHMDVVTFATVLKIYSTSGNLDGALNVYEDMKALGMKPNLVIYNTVLDVTGKSKRPWQVRTVFEEMTNNGISPNIQTYAALIRAYCKAHYVGDALNIYREVKEKGLVLNVKIYNILLAMCADMGCATRALLIFEDMKRSENCRPDCWTFSCLITTYSSIGKVKKAEGILKEMLEAGIEPDIFVLTSFIQCYGKAKQTDGVLRTFDRLLELGITPDDRFFCCLLNVMNRIRKEELGKLVSCIERANPKLGYVVKLLLEDAGSRGFKQEALELIESISTNVRKSYCNGLIDLCVNLNLTERACELFDLGLTLKIYTDIQSKSSTQWSLHLRTLSIGGALTALHIWMKDLFNALDNAEELPPMLGIDTGHSKRNYSKRLASEFAYYLRELNAPFVESPDTRGWFLSTRVAAKSWLNWINS